VGSEPVAAMFDGSLAIVDGTDDED
jgi:hypothetical protein